MTAPREGFMHPQCFLLVLQTLEGQLEKCTSISKHQNLDMECSVFASPTLIWEDSHSGTAKEESSAISRCRKFINELNQLVKIDINSMGTEIPTRTRSGKESQCCEQPH
ncbi:hypothetical protein AgCh_030200 [Apium graveolens]